jgi:phosphatidylglycerol:prolipoprotein diacylglycerol transferase
MLAPPLVHTAFEICAYTAGMRVFLSRRRPPASPTLADADRRLWIIVGAALGAALGAKLAFWIEDPAVAFAGFPDWRHLLGGKSIVGGLLGGLVGVETTKHALGQSASTGDDFVLPLAVGIAIGRLGCFFAGLADHTYGIATSLPWAVDFGDGVPRHPTQLYEIAFVLAWTALLRWRRTPAWRTGDLFRAWLAGYLLFRLAVEAIKPVPHLYAPFGGGIGLTGIQWLCVLGLAYYARDLPRLVREISWATR